MAAVATISMDERIQREWDELNRLERECREHGSSSAMDAEVQQRLDSIARIQLECDEMLGSKKNPIDIDNSKNLELRQVYSDYTDMMVEKADSENRLALALFELDEYKTLVKTLQGRANTMESEASEAIRKYRKENEDLILQISALQTTIDEVKLEREDAVQYQKKRVASLEKTLRIAGVDVNDTINAVRQRDDEIAKLQLENRRKQDMIDCMKVGQNRAEETVKIWEERASAAEETAKQQAKEIAQLKAQLAAASGPLSSVGQRKRQRVNKN